MTGWIEAPEKAPEDAQIQRQEAMNLLGVLRAKVKPGPLLDWKELRDAGKKY